MAEQIEADFGAAVTERLKWCAGCARTLPWASFGKSRNRKHGLHPTCKSCMSRRRSAALERPGERERKREYFRAYGAANRDKTRATQTKWRQANVDLARARVRACVAANPDRQRESERAYRANNPDKRRASCAAYRAANLDKERAYRVQYCKANLDKLAARAATRRSIKLKATPPWACEATTLAIYAEAQRVTRETGVKHHVDHIVPLKSKIVCGLHCPANLRVIPGRENLSKGNRSWPDMP